MPISNRWLCLWSLICSLVGAATYAAAGRFLSTSPSPHRQGAIARPSGAIPAGANVDPGVDPTTGGLEVSVVGGVPSLAGTVYHLGGTGAGLYQITDAGTPLAFGCYVCGDDTNTSAIYCAADSAVVGDAGASHKGFPLAASACAWVPVNDASKVFCQLGGQSEIAQCY